VTFLPLAAEDVLRAGDQALVAGIIDQSQFYIKFTLVTLHGIIDTGPIRKGYLNQLWTYWRPIE